MREARGQIFGGPVAISGGTRAGGTVEFVARGEAQPAALGPLFDHPLKRFLSGSSLYVASVSLRDGLQRVVVDSSLRGVTSALPPPLEKAAADALPLRVEFEHLYVFGTVAEAVSWAGGFGGDTGRGRNKRGWETSSASIRWLPTIRWIRGV